MDDDADDMGPAVSYEMQAIHLAMTLCLNNKIKPDQMIEYAGKFLSFMKSQTIQ